jgi:hypothetical protein
MRDPLASQRPMRYPTITVMAVRIDANRWSLGCGDAVSGRGRDGCGSAPVPGPDRAPGVDLAGAYRNTFVVRRSCGVVCGWDQCLSWSQPLLLCVQSQAAACSGVQGRSARSAA